MVVLYLRTQEKRSPVLFSKVIEAVGNHTDPVVVLPVLEQLMREEIVRAVVAVRTPSGIVLDKVYGSVEEIDDVVFDPLHHKFEKNDLEVLQGLEIVG